MSPRKSGIERIGQASSGDWEFHLELHPAQREVWESEARFKVVAAGRRFGKALALDTPVPTPDGWTTMGELKVGDQVFSQDGSVTTVTFVTGPQYGRDCYEVEFHHGGSVVADADHQWAARPRKDRRNGNDKPFGVVTTREMSEKLRVSGESNWEMPQARPLQLPEADLPIDPYVLGVWLGDGSSYHGSVTFGPQDFDELSGLLGARGCSVTPSDKRPVHGRALTVSVGCAPRSRSARGTFEGNSSLHSTLKDLGLLGNKHIPPLYLRASVSQREDLLAGLIDTDGYVDHCTGGIELTTVKENLALSYLELVRSLGHRATMSRERAMLNGRDVGPKFRVTWSARSGGGYLARKRVRDRSFLGRPTGLTTRTVKDIRPVPSVPVCCITVDHPSSLYLVGREMLVTHNTVLGMAKIMVAVTSKPKSVGLWVAPSHSQSRIGLDQISSIIPRQHREVNRTLSEIYLPNGSKILFRSGERWDNLRGEGLVCAVLDEAAFLDERVWTEAVRPALSDHKGDALLISTFNGENWFYHRFRNALETDNDQWESWRFRTLDNPFIDPAEVEEAKRNLPREVFEQEYEASPMAFSGAVFDGAKLDAAAEAGKTFTMPSPTIKRPTVPGVPVIVHNTYPSEAGLDWGWLYTAMEVCVETPDGKVAWVYEKVFERIELRERCHLIARACRDWNVQTIYCDAAGASENVTLARVLEETGVRTYVQPVPFATYKKVGIQTRNYFLEQGREILTPACPGLRVDSKAYHYEPDGEKPAKGSDHTVDAATAYFASRSDVLGGFDERVAV